MAIVLCHEEYTAPNYVAHPPKQDYARWHTAHERFLMKALTWQAKRTVSVEEVPDPTIIEPTDAIIRITSTAICGSDLHLYEVLGPFMDKGDVIGHEPMGIVEEVGAGVTVEPQLLSNSVSCTEVLRRVALDLRCHLCTVV